MLPWVASMQGSSQHEEAVPAPNVPSQGEVGPAPLSYEDSQDDGRPAGCQGDDDICPICPYGIACR
jgi:hypothetical protein